MKLGLPMLALALAACAHSSKGLDPIPATPEQRQCPILATPPEALMEPPRKMDFLSPTGSSQLNKPSSSTRSNNG